MNHNIICKVLSNPRLTYVQKKCYLIKIEKAIKAQKALKAYKNNQFKVT